MIDEWYWIWRLDVMMFDVETCLMSLWLMLVEGIERDGKKVRKRGRRFIVS